MRKYLERLRHEYLLLNYVKMQQISRNNNYHTDALAILTSVHDMKIQQSVTITILSWASLSEAEKVINQVEHFVGSWFDPFVKYLNNRTLIEDKKKAYAIVNKLNNYFL